MGVITHVAGYTVPARYCSSNNSVLKNSNMQKEIWKDVVGFEGSYKVSNLGRVKSLEREYFNGHGYFPVKERILSGRISNGYAYVQLSNGYKKNYSIHRLKATAFIPNPENKPQVNHRDGNKSNNGYNADGDDNLEWATRSENVRHSYRELGQRSPCLGKFGVDNPSSKAIIQSTKSGVFVAEYASGSNAKEKTGISNCDISSCCHGRLKSAGGFKWEFKPK